MRVIAIKEGMDELEDNQKIIQITFFDELTEEDIRKTKWLLGKYTDMIDTIQNYEIAQRELENGMSAYELLTAEGSAGKRVSGEELTSDVTANSIVLKEKREMIYKFYVALTNIIKAVVSNLRDSHEKQIIKFLFIDGKRYLEAQSYMEKGYKKHIPGIGATTFADKRRRAIARIADGLKNNGTLDYLVINYGKYRKDEIGLRFPTGIYISTI